MSHLSKGFRFRNGRNNSGVVVFRTRAGGYKNLYRFIDYYLLLPNMLPSIVVDFIYDSLRTGYIMAVIYINGIFSYRLAPYKIKLGRVFFSYTNEKSEGYVRNLLNFISGDFVFSVPVVQGGASVLSRAAGTYVQILRVDFYRKLVLLKLRTGVKYLVSGLVFGVFGRVSFIDWIDLYYGKAGKRRCLGFRSIVRGIARNPVDHPNGGRTPGGKVYCSFSNNIARSTKSTRRRKLFNKYIGVLNF